MEVSIREFGELAMYKVYHREANEEISRLKEQLAAYEPEDHDSSWVPVAEHKDYVDRSRKQVCKLNDTVLRLRGDRGRFKELAYNIAKATDRREKELLPGLSCRSETWEHALDKVVKMFGLNAD